MADIKRRGAPGINTIVQPIRYMTVVCIECQYGNIDAVTVKD